MPERATLNQITQVGAEVTPGTAVAATKLWQALSVTPGIKTDIAKFKPAGAKFTTIAALGKEWVEAKLEGVGCYNHMAYLMAMIMGYAAPVQQGGTTAYKWTATPGQNTEDVIKTLTVEQGSQLRAGKFVYGLLTQLGLSIDRSGIKVSGSLLGQAYQDDIHLSTNATYTLTAGVAPPTAGTFTLTYSGQTTGAIAFDAAPAAVEAALEALSTVGAGNVEVVATVATGAGTLAVGGNVYTIEFTQALAQAPRTLTGTFTGLTAAGTIALAAGVTGVVPTAIPIQPMLPTDVDIYMDTTGAGIGGTKLTRALKTEFDISDRYGEIWTLNSAVDGFAAHVETEPKVQLKLTVEADAAGMAPLTVMRTGDKRFIQIKITSSVLAGVGYAYSFTLGLACVVTDVSEFKDEDGVYGIEWTFDVAYDATWGKALIAELIDVLTAL